MARRDAEKGRDQLSEEDEDQKHVEEPGRRLGGADLHRLPDEAGEEKGGAESHETAEEKEEPVRREDDVGRAADSKNLPASEREGGHDRRPPGRDREGGPIATSQPGATRLSAAHASRTRVSDELGNAAKAERSALEEVQKRRKPTGRRWKSERIAASRRPPAARWPASAEGTCAIIRNCAA